MDDAPILEPQRSASSSAAAAGPSKPAMTPAAPPSLRRKRLADISNLSIDRSVATSSSFTSTGKENPVSIAAAASTKDAYIAQLLKENNALIRALGERNKVIELSAAEIKNVRCALQKLTQQNQHLAHANTLMLAERNQDKDKLKTLQHEVGCVQAALKAQKHEVGCVQAALKAQNFVLEEEKKLNRQLKARIGSEQVNLGCHSKMDFVVEDSAIPVAQNTSEEKMKLNRELKARIDSEQVNLGCHSEMDFVMEDPAIPVAQNTSEPVMVDANADARPELDLVMEDPPIPATQKKAPSTNRKRTPSVTNLQDGVKEKDVSSRRSSRRRATSLRNNLCEPNENLIEIEDINLSAVPQLIDDSVSSRRSSRRRATSLRNNRCEPNENLIEIEDINLSVVPQLIDDPMSRDSSNQAVPSAPSVSNATTDSVTEERPKEPIGTLQVQKEPITLQVQKEPITSQVQIQIQIQTEPIASQVQIQKEPIGTSQVQVQIQKEPIVGTSQVQIQKEPIGTSQVQIPKKPIASQVQIQKEPIGTSQVQIQKERITSQVQIQKESQVQIQEVRRLSVDRPTRRAKEKVCYKEIPLNVKMRREN